MAPALPEPAGRAGLSRTRLKKNTFSQVQLGGNRRLYQFLLSVCRLLYENAIVDENTGRTVFYDFRRDEGAGARRVVIYVGYISQSGLEWLVGMSPRNWKFLAKSADAHATYLLRSMQIKAAGHPNPDDELKALGRRGATTAPAGGGSGTYHCATTVRVAWSHRRPPARGQQSPPW